MTIFKDDFKLFLYLFNDTVQAQSQLLSRKCPPCKTTQTNEKGEPSLVRLSHI
jgi:hypothetical protein